MEHRKEQSNRKNGREETRQAERENKVSRNKVQGKENEKVKQREKKKSGK